MHVKKLKSTEKEKEKLEVQIKSTDKKAKPVVQSKSTEKERTKIDEKKVIQTNNEENINLDEKESE